MMIKWAGLLLVALGCSGSSDSEGPAKPRVGSGAGTCSDRTGQTYVAKLTDRGGSCHLNGEIVVVVAAPDPDAGPEACRGTVTASADLCEVTVDTNCPSKTQVGWRLVEQGKAKWSVDGSYGTAVETIGIVDENGNAQCSSTVDVEYQRQ